jgi:hypothetical protein
VNCRRPPVSPRPCLLRDLPGPALAFCLGLALLPRQLHCRLAAWPETFLAEPRYACLEGAWGLAFRCGGPGLWASYRLETAFPRRAGRCPGGWSAGGAKTWGSHKRDKNSKALTRWPLRVSTCLCSGASYACSLASQCCVHWPVQAGSCPLLLAFFHMQNTRLQHACSGDGNARDGHKGIAVRCCTECLHCLSLFSRKKAENKPMPARTKPWT